MYNGLNDTRHVPNLILLATYIVRHHPNNIISVQSIIDRKSMPYSGLCFLLYTRFSVLVIINNQYYNILVFLYNQLMGDSGCRLCAMVSVRVLKQLVDYYFDIVL